MNTYFASAAEKRIYPQTMKRRACALFSLVCLLCLAGPACSRYKIATAQRNSNLRTYTGPLLPKDSVGYLACPIPDLEIAEIDAVPVKQLKAKTRFEGSFNYIELLPGEHAVLVKGSTYHTTRRGFHTDLTVDISSYTFSLIGESKLCFAVEPGHVYVVNYKITKNQSQEVGRPFSHAITIVIKDVLTGKVVCRFDTDIKR